MNERSGSFNVTALRCLPYSLLFRAMVSFGMLAVVVAEMIRNGGNLPEIEYIDPNIEILIIAAVLSYIIGCFCLSGIQDLSEDLRTAFKLLVVQTLLVCGIIAAACFGMCLLHYDKMTAADLLFLLVKLCLLISVMIEAGAFCRVMSGIGSELERIDMPDMAKRSKAVGKIYLYLNLILFVLVVIDVALGIDTKGYGFLLISAGWTAMQFLMFLIVRFSSFNIWRYRVTGGHDV